MTTYKKALSSQRALVRIFGHDAGYLDMVATDEYRFVYLKQYREDPHAQPLSLTMPLRVEPYISHTLLPFFDNLLFEGDQLRLAEKYFDLSRYSVVDRFRLLVVTGRRLLSPVSVHPVLLDNSLVEFDSDSGWPTQDKTYLRVESAYPERCHVCILKSQGFGHRACLDRLWGTRRTIQLESFADEPANVFRTIIPGQSISGAQRKALFHLSKQGILSRMGGFSHILKPEGDFPQMPANEHLTMTIAEHLGFPTPPNGLVRVEGIGLIYVTRRFDESGFNKHYAIEDMAQLAEELAENKDRASLESVASIIGRFSSSPRIELAEFFRRVVFCFITGNGDMHLKNWALRYGGHSDLVKLAPVYDFLNVRCCYPQEQVEMILSLNRKQANLRRQDFLAFADFLELPEAYIKKVFQDLPRWHDVINGYCENSALTKEMQKRYREIVQERVARLLAINSDSKLG